MNVTNTTDYLPLSAVMAVAIPDTVLSLSIVSVRIVVIILCIIWRNEPCLKIRWPIPIVASVCLLLFYDSSKFLASWSFSGGWPDNIIQIRLMFIWPGFVMIGIGFTHHYLRFYLLRYLDDAKLSERIVNTKYLTMIVSTKAMIVAVFIAFITLYPFSIVMATIALLYPVHVQTLSTVVLVLNVSLVLLNVLLCAFISIHDFAKNIGNGIRLYFAEDPYIFRVEGVVSVVVLVTLVAFGAVIVIPRRNPSLKDPLFMTQWIFTRAVTIVAEILFSVLCGLLCVVAIMLVKLRPVQSTVENETDLQKLLRVGGKRRRLFDTYLKSEFSSENMLCYNDLIVYHEKKSQEELLQLVPALHEKYIKQGTLREVNLPDSIRKEYAAIMESADSTIEQLNKLLESLEREVLVNLGDSFMRFKFTPTYRRLSDLE